MRGGEGRVDRRGGGRREMPVVGVHDSFLKNSSQKRGGGGGLLK